MRALAFLLILLFVAPAVGQTLTENEYALRGSWYDPATSGQGVVVDVIPISAARTAVFVGWYTYSRTDGRKFWLTLGGDRANDSTDQTLTIYETAGGRFNAPPVGTSTAVGTATLRPQANGELVMEFAFDRPDPRWDQSGSMRLTRFTDQAAVLEENRHWRASWYDPETSGQGLQLDIIGMGYTSTGAARMVLFGAWYTYTPAGEPMWLTVGGDTDALALNGTYTLYLTPDAGRFNAGPVVAAERVGSATLTYDIGTGTLAIDFRFDRADPRWVQSGRMVLGSFQPQQRLDHVIDTSDRAAVVEAFHDRYLATVPATGWSGSADGCSPGTLSEDYRQRVVAQVNYYRAMAGVPAIALERDPAIEREVQSAALVWSANRVLTHYPTPEMVCFSAAAARGAFALGAAEPSIRNNGHGAVGTHMFDPGQTNRSVGHRRALLDPAALSASVADAAFDGAYSSAIRMQPAAARNASGDASPWIAWPSAGYLPFPIVPTRWSFSISGADMTNATVRMSESDGTPISLVVEHRDSSNTRYPTLAWAPDTSAGLLPNNAPTHDRAIVVDVENVRVAGVPKSYRYAVIVIDPN